MSGDGAWQILHRTRRGLRRRQPRLSWLAFGSGVAVFLWGVVTLGLGLFYRSDASFGQTYGRAAGLVALLLWCLLSSMAVFFGAAVGAKLEAVRADAPAPQDVRKVARSKQDRGEQPITAARS